MTDDTGNTENEAEQSADDPVVLPQNAIDEDVEFDAAYRAMVNNTVHYGVFVTLAGWGRQDNVTGLVQAYNLPPGVAPDDFVVEDVVAVQLLNRSEKGLDLEIVEVLEGAKGTTETQGTPVRDYSPATDEDETTGERPASTVATEPGLDAITARLDPIEAHLALDAATVRARVVDVGDDATLLCVFDGESEIDVDHGEVVTVTLTDTGGREIEEDG